MRVVQLLTVAALVAPLSALRPMLSGATLPQHRRAPAPRMAKTKAKASKRPGQANCASSLRISPHPRPALTLARILLLTLIPTLTLILTSPSL